MFGLMGRDNEYIPLTPHDARFIHRVFEERDLRTQQLSAALADNAKLREALEDAATSLHTISMQAGRLDELKAMSQVRGYANSRWMAAHNALAGKEGA